MPALLILASLVAASGPAILRDAGTDLGPSALFVLDQGRTLSAEDLLSGRADARLQPFGEKQRGFGFSGDPLWIRVVVVSESAREWRFVWDAPRVERLDLWVEGPSRHEHLRGGSALPIEQRTIRDRGPDQVAMLPFAAGERATLLVRAEMRGPLYAALALRSATALARRDREVVAVAAFDAAVLLVLIAMALYSFIALRDRLSITYAMLLTSFAAYQWLGVLGIGAAYLWPRSPWWSLVSAPLFANGCCFLLGVYARRFLHAAEHHARFDRAIRATQWLMALDAILMAVNLGRGSLGVTVLAVVMMTLVLGLAVAATLRGDRPARFFLAAVAGVTATALLIVCSHLGIVAPRPVYIFALHASVWIGGVVLLFGLADRLSSQTREAHLRLERTVAERTADLTRIVEDLRTSEERFRTVFQTIPDAVAISGLEDGRYAAINTGYERLFGWREAEVLGRTSFDLDLWCDLGDRIRLVEVLQRDGHVLNLPLRLRRKDRREIDVEISAQIIQLPEGPRMITVTRDISARTKAEAERNRLQDELRQVQKMEAIGQLAGGIAHDFNNLLSVIIGGAEMLREQLPVDSPFRPDLAEISKAGDRAAALTRQLLAFSRRQVLQPRSVDLNQTVLGMEKMLRRLVGEDVELTFHTAPDLGLLHADPGQIEQVVLNLVVNARDALPRGGTIGIETSAASFDAARAQQAGVTQGPYVLLNVSDDGIGMDDETRARIFEPFFTTKEQGKGTGLGLSTVFGIVRQSGGQIEVESKPGKGSTFRIWLPQAQAASAPHVATPPPPMSLRGSETVLLVEDQDEVRAPARTALRRNGYKVLEAQNGGEAFLICEQLKEPIHLLITDVVMPRMSGYQLAERLSALHPEMKVIFLSGYAHGAPPTASFGPASADFLQKPITPDAFLRKVREVLG